MCRLAEQGFGNLTGCDSFLEEDIFTNTELGFIKELFMKWKEDMTGFISMTPSSL